jgi:hypothetical protein
MDITFAESLDQFRKWLHEVDPATPAGLEGAQMPATFGGYDLWRLSQALDWVEPYDIGNSHDMFRDFMPDGAPIYATLFEHDPNQAGRRLWHLLLNGDTGVIIWCSSDWFDYESPDLTPEPFVARMGEVFAELQGPAARAIMNAKRDRPQIAVHYSHPSVQVGWMLDSREDGDTWPRRFSSYEGVHSRITRNRAGWTKLVTDLGLQYEFVSTAQILDGSLVERGYKVLVLPQSMAISDHEAAKIEAYAAQGGNVIADFLPGVFDGHGKRRSGGILDAFFGVSRAGDGMIRQPEQSEDPGCTPGSSLYVWSPAELDLRLSPAGGGAVDSDFTPVLVRQQRGSGAARYLNISLIDYGKWRLEGKGGGLRQLVGRILEQSGVWPPVRVTSAAGGGPPVGCEVIGYQGNGCRYLAIMRNPEYRVGSLGEIGYGDNSRFEKPEDFVVEMRKPLAVRELLSRRDFGETSRVEVTLDPWKPVILELAAVRASSD